MFLNISKKYYFIAVAVFAAVLAYFTISPEKGEINEEYATKVVDVASEEKIVVNVDNIKASLKVDGDAVLQAQQEAEAQKQAEAEAKKKEEAERKKAEEEAKNEESQKQEETSVTEEKADEATGSLEKGSVLNLNNEPLYISSTITTPKNYKTGKFYVWGMEANGRITITSSPDFVGVEGKVTGWIDKPAQH